MNGTRQGQSAMEYLMTYGWAILIIILMLAIFINLNIGRVPEGCAFDDNAFTCQGERLLSEDIGSRNSNQPGLSNLLYADIANARPRAVRIVGMACTSSHAPSMAGDGNFQDRLFRVPEGGADQPLVLIHQGSFNTGMVPQNRFRLQCFDVDAAGDVRSVFLQPGSVFVGQIYVLYKGANEPAYVPAKLVRGRIVTTVQ